MCRMFPSRWPLTTPWSSASRALRPGGITILVGEWLLRGACSAVAWSTEARSYAPSAMTEANARSTGASKSGTGVESRVSCVVTFAESISAGFASTTKCNLRQLLLFRLSSGGAEPRCMVNSVLSIMIWTGPDTATDPILRRGSLAHRRESVEWSGIPIFKYNSSAIERKKTSVCRSANP